MKKINILLGAGGHAKVIYDLLKKKGLSIDFVVDPKKKIDLYFKKTKHLLNENDILNNFLPNTCNIIMGLGSTNRKSILLRKKIFYKFNKKGYNFLKVIHNFSYISETSNLSEGVQVFAGSIIQPSCNIGENTIINTKVSIDHDCDIKSNCHIAPGVTLCGGVKIGKDSIIGAGAILLPNTKLPSNSFVKAGTCVN